MSMADFIRDIEVSMIAHRPVLSRELKPGVLDKKLNRVLAKQRFSPESLSCIRCLYAWRDGRELDSFVSLQDLIFFSYWDVDYYLLTFELAVLHAEANFQGGGNSEDFPFLWNGSIRHIAISRTDAKVKCLSKGKVTHEIGTFEFFLGELKSYFDTEPKRKQ